MNTCFTFLATDVICQLIEMAAGERFNRSAALVMQATLKATEARQKSVSDARSGKIHCNTRSSCDCLKRNRSYIDCCDCHAHF